MPSFHLKLQTKKSVKKWRNPGGVQMTPPLGLRVTIFSLGLLGLMYHKVSVSVAEALVSKEVSVSK